MSLPKWIEDTDRMDFLLDALSIAWKALERCAAGEPRRFIAKEALRRIEELGKDDK